MGDDLRGRPHKSHWGRLIGRVESPWERKSRGVSPVLFWSPRKRKILRPPSLGKLGARGVTQKFFGGMLKRA